MRITGGKYRGSTLASPKDDRIRPTADRVRESLFNILSHHPAVDLVDATVLDVFCGAGTLGLEALSRGAEFCLFIDNSKTSLQLCQQNAAKLKTGNSAAFLKHNAAASWPGGAKIPNPVTLLFADPPYGKNLALPAIRNIARAGILAPTALIVIEMSAKHPESGDFSDFNLIDDRKYGDTILQLYQMKNPGS